jgi:hypothetical protein
MSPRMQERIELLGRWCKRLPLGHHQMPLNLALMVNIFMFVAYFDHGSCRSVKYWRRRSHSCATTLQLWSLNSAFPELDFRGSTVVFIDRHRFTASERFKHVPASASGSFAPAMARTWRPGPTSGSCTESSDERLCRTPGHVAPLVPAGASSCEELFAHATLLSMPAPGIVDRNSLAGIVRAHEAAKVTGVRLVVGCRLDLADGLSVLV